RLEIDNLEAGDDTALGGLLDSLVDRGDEFAGDDPTHDGVHESVAFVAAQRSPPDVTVAELNTTARLLIVSAVGLRTAADRFAIGDFRLAGVDRDVVLPLHPLELNLEMKLPATARDRLPQLRDIFGDEAGILLVQHVERV